MPDIRLIVADDLEVVGVPEVHKHEWILLVGNSAGTKSPMKTDKNSVVEPIRKRAGRKRDIVGTLAFRPGKRIGLWLKDDQRLHAPAAACQHARSINGVIRWKTKIRHGAIPHLRRPDHVQLVGAQWLIWIYQTIDAIILIIQIASD